MPAPTAESVAISVAGGLMIVSATTGLSYITHPPNSVTSHLHHEILVKIGLKFTQK